MYKNCKKMQNSHSILCRCGALRYCYCARSVWLSRCKCIDCDTAQLFELGTTSYSPYSQCPHHLVNPELYRSPVMADCSQCKIYYGVNNLGKIINPQAQAYQDMKKYPKPHLATK